MTPDQLRAARAILNLEQTDVAKASGVHRNTLMDFEKGDRQPRQSTIDAIRAALEAAGVDFIAENGGGAGVRLTKRSRSEKAPPR